MTKRRISKTQKKRIDDMQAQRRQRAKDKAIEDDATLGPEQHGLLIAHFYDKVDVESSDGSIVHCKLRQNLGSLVSGDRVIWRAITNDTGVVVALEPRKSSLTKPDRFNKLKSVAANVDQVVIVSAPEPELNTLLIDSYLVAIEYHNLSAMILFQFDGPVGMVEELFPAMVSFVA